MYRVDDLPLSVQKTKTITGFRETSVVFLPRNTNCVHGLQSCTYSEPAKPLPRARARVLYISPDRSKTSVRPPTQAKADAFPPLYKT